MNSQHQSPSRSVQVSSTALKSNRTMKDQLAARQLTDRVQVIRSRIEGDPRRYGGLGSRLDRAERSIMDRRLVDARDHLIDIEQAIAAKDEAAQTKAQQEEQERLAEARNSPTDKTETGVATRDGWLWLERKKRFTGTRLQAGRIFREKYAKATGSSVKSCIAESTGGGGGDATPTASQVHARFEIDGVRAHMRSAIGQTNGGALFSLLEEVCGKGETVRSLVDGDDRKADAKVIELGFALDLAGVYLGVART